MSPTTVWQLHQSLFILFENLNSPTACKCELSMKIQSKTLNFSCISIVCLVTLPKNSWNSCHPIWQKYIQLLKFAVIVYCICFGLIHIWIWLDKFSFQKRTRRNQVKPHLFGNVPRWYTENHLYLPLVRISLVIIIIST